MNPDLPVFALAFAVIALLVLIMIALVQTGTLTAILDELRKWNNRGK